MNTGEKLCKSLPQIETNKTAGYVLLHHDRIILSNHFSTLFYLLHSLMM